MTWGFIGQIIAGNVQSQRHGPVDKKVKKPKSRKKFLIKALICCGLKGMAGSKTSPPPRSGKLSAAFSKTFQWQNWSPSYAESLVIRLRDTDCGKVQCQNLLGRDTSSFDLSVDWLIVRTPSTLWLRSVSEIQEDNGRVTITSAWPLYIREMIESEWDVVSHSVLFLLDPRPKA